MEELFDRDRSQGDRPSEKRWFRRLLQFDSRFLMFTTALVGIGMLWWQDRRKLEERLEAIEIRYKPFIGNAWAAEQATGPPNTTSAGDQPTAWASKTPDGQEEWLELIYEQTVRPYAVEIHETYNPGSVTKVTSFDRTGNEVILWQGVDPTAATERSGVSTITVKNSVATNRIRIYLDSQKFSGWNEIDAVGLRHGFFGSVIWASRTTASSEFGQSGFPNNSSRFLIPPFLRQ